MKRQIGIILVGGMLLAGVQAAEISWTTNAITGLESDVVTNGTLIEAMNGAHTSRTETPTVNGVTFISDGRLLGGNWNGDPWSPVATNEYDTLLSTIDFEGNGTGPVTIKTFNGLTEGAEYLIQVWHADYTATRTMTYEGTGDVVLNGQSYAVGTFTADASAQDLIVTASQSGTRLTAYQLRAISGHIEPDPIIDLSVSNLTFGATYIGYTNRMTLTVQNLGGKVLDGTASVAAPFSIESGAAYSLSNNQQVVTVLFAPQSEGEVTESLVFTGGGGTNISVTGTGEAQPESSIGLNVSNLTFVSTPIGSTNSLIVTVKNEGGGTLTGTASVVAPFAVASGADYSLALGEVQDVVILFAPVAEGEFMETLSFSGGGGVEIPVSGTGELIIGTLVADVAADYTGSLSEPDGWDYLYSDAASGGNEGPLTPNSAVSTINSGGNIGFAHIGGQYNVPSVLGRVTSGDNQYEIFNDSYDGKNSDQAYGHYGEPGKDLLMHPGSGTAGNGYVIVRYTFSEADLAGSSIVDITGSFRDEVGGTSGNPVDSVLAEVYHNDVNLFSVSGTNGRLWQTNGTFNVTDLAVEVGDAISFVVGNNGNLAGDETALSARIVAKGSTPPSIKPGVDVVDGHLEFQITGALGLHYRVESKNDLVFGNWETIQDVNPLTVLPMDISVPATNQAAFFRVIHVE